MKVTVASSQLMSCVPSGHAGKLQLETISRQPDKWPTHNREDCHHAGPVTSPRCVWSGWTSHGSHCWRQSLLRTAISRRQEKVSFLGYTPSVLLKEFFVIICFMAFSWFHPPPPPPPPLFFSIVVTSSFQSMWKLTPARNKKMCV